MTYAEPPTGDCPKCGTPNAWKGARPMYVTAEPYTDPRGDANETPDYLSWDCNWCGYSKKTAPADSTAPDDPRHVHRFVGVPGALVGDVIRDIGACECGAVLTDGLVLT